MREWWKNIEGYEDLYQISNLGRIKTLDPRYNGKVMKLELDRSDYLVIRLVRFGVRKRHAIHKLVYLHFNGPLAADDVVHHIDENKLNNASNNLMRMTVAEHRALHNKGSVKPIIIKL